MRDAEVDEHGVTVDEQDVARLEVPVDDTGLVDRAQGLGELIALLSEHGIGAVVVSGDGEAVDGIVSERDVVRHLHSGGGGIVDGPVSAIMTAEVRTCSAGDQVADLEATMTEHRIRHVPVVEDGRLVGIVSIVDVVVP